MFDPRLLCCSSLTTAVGGTTDTNFVDSAHPTVARINGMKRHVGDFVRRCLTCQRVKAEQQKPAELLQPLEVAEWKWEHVIMDFVTHLPRTQQKHDAVWVIMDRLTKSTHFLAMRMTFALERFCRLYI